MTSANLQSISARIRALLAKTTAAGATEAEAQAAFDKAHELLAKYQLELSDLEIREEGTSKAYLPYDATEIGRFLCVRVAEFCDCRVWVHHGKQVAYLGLKSDSQLAEWMTLALVGFVQRRALEWLIQEGGTLADRQAFIGGCCQRLNERLKEATEQRTQAPTSNGRQLISLKNQLVEEAWAKKNLRLKPGRGPNRAYRSGGQAYSAGAAAGNEASLHKPARSASKGLIGGPSK